MTPKFTKKFLAAKLAVSQAKVELLQILIDETEKNQQLGLADLQIEIEAVEGLDVRATPRHWFHTLGRASAIDVSQLPGWEEFWRCLERSTNAFEEPALVGAAGFKIAEIEADVRDSLRHLSVKERALVRAYVGGRQCYRLERRLVQEPPGAQEPLEQWFARFSDEAGVGFILNDAARWSDPLARRCGQMVAPMLAKFPSPQLALDATLFIGDYGFTPFGAHVDDLHHRTVHLHLGPAPKDFHFWEPMEFRRLTGGESVSHDFENLLEYSTTLTVNPGGAILIPSRFVHVARTRGFSVGLALILSKTSHAAAFAEATGLALSQLKRKLACVSPTSPQLVPEATNYLALPLGFDTMTASEWGQRLMEEYALLKASNCGLRSPPPERDAPALEDLGTLDTQLVEPFSIELRCSEDELALFVRHRKITLRPVAEVGRLVEILNSRRRIPVPALVDDLSSSLSPEATLGLLRQIYCFRGIDFHPSSAT